MPNRFIRESARRSETLAQLTGDEERCFWRLTVVVDDFGRFDGRAAIVRAECFQAQLDTITATDVERWLARLEAVGLIERYVVDGRPYLAFRTWTKHQTTRAKASKWPQPPAPARVCTQMHADASVFVSDIRDSRFESESESGAALSPVDPEPEPPEPVPTVAADTPPVVGVSLVKAPIPKALVLTPAMRRIALEEDANCANVPACFRDYKGYFSSRAGDRQFWRYDWVDYEWRRWMQRHRRFGGPCQRKPTAAENARDAAARRTEAAARGRARAPDEPQAIATALGAVLGDAHDVARAKIRAQAAQLKATA